MLEAILFTGPLHEEAYKSHFDNAARILNELRITDAKHQQTILTSAAHVAEANRYNHDLKTGKVKTTRNPRGLLLVRLGLVAPKVAAVAK